MCKASVTPPVDFYFLDCTFVKQLTAVMFLETEVTILRQQGWIMLRSLVSTLHL